MNLVDYNAIADEVSERRAQREPGTLQRVLPAYRAVVLTVHGMRSRGAWQKDLNVPLTDAGFLHHPIDLSHIGFIAVTRPKTANRAAAIVADAYHRLRGRANSVSAIGHSFGTVAIGKALQTNPTMKLDRIILWGSVLRASFPWRSNAALSGQAQSVLNEACWRDMAPYFACIGCVLHGGGLSGAWGFNEADGIAVFNRFHSWTNHSKLGTPMYCEDAWIPFLDGAVPAGS